MRFCPRKRSRAAMRSPMKGEPFAAKRRTIHSERSSLLPGSERAVGYIDSILGHVMIDFIRPGADAAFDALEVLETLLAQELKRPQGTHAALAVKVILLVRIQFGEPLR